MYLSWVKSMGQEVLQLRVFLLTMALSGGGCVWSPGCSTASSAGTASTGFMACKGWLKHGHRIRTRDWRTSSRPASCPQTPPTNLVSTSLCSLTKSRAQMSLGVQRTQDMLGENPTFLHSKLRTAKITPRWSLQWSITGILLR